MLTSGGTRHRRNNTLKLPLLDNQLLEAALPIRLLEECLLDCRGSGKAVHNDRFFLSDPVRAVLRLQVLLRVPVAVEEDDCVSGGKVDTEAARARAEQKQVPSSIMIEAPDLLSAIRLGDSAIDAAHASHAARPPTPR